MRRTIHSLSRVLSQGTCMSSYSKYSMLLMGRKTRKQGSVWYLFVICTEVLANRAAVASILQT